MKSLMRTRAKNRVAIALLAVVAFAAGLAAVPAGASSAPAAPLLVGVGRADITPVTGGYKGG